MDSITLADAKLLVRKNLDEQSENASAMLADTDSGELDTLIAKMLPEAVNSVHEAAPNELLQGDGVTLLSNSPDVNGVRDYLVEKDVLRVVSFKASDSVVTLYGSVDDSSNLGRQQTNRYTRGDYTNPVLVRERGSEASLAKSAFRYYCHRPNSSSLLPNATMTIIERCRYSSTKVSYPAEKACIDRILWYLTGMVATALGMGDAAAAWFNKASFVSKS